MDGVILHNKEIWYSMVFAYHGLQEHLKDNITLEDIAFYVMSHSDGVTVALLIVVQHFPVNICCHCPFADNSSLALLSVEKEKNYQL